MSDTETCTLAIPLEVREADGGPRFKGVILQEGARGRATRGVVRARKRHLAIERDLDPDGASRRGSGARGSRASSGRRD